MDEEKRTKKKKSDRTEKRKRVLQISSNAEIEEAAAIKQAKASINEYQKPKFQPKNPTLKKLTIC